MSNVLSRAIGALFLLSLVACSSSSAGVVSSSIQAPTVQSAPECDAAREVAAVLARIDLSDRAGIEALPDQVSQLAGVVPEELGEDVATLSSAVGGLVDVLRKYDFDLVAIEANADARLDLEELNRPEVVTATQHIQNWIDLSCA